MDGTFRVEVLRYQLADRREDRVPKKRSKKRALAARSSKRSSESKLKPSSLRAKIALTKGDYRKALEELAAAAAVDCPELSRLLHLTSIDRFNNHDGRPNRAVAAETH